MRVVIAGGGGFIGSALIKRLAQKHQCVCYGSASRYTELRALIDGEVEYVEGDVNDAQLLVQVLHEADAVIQVAGGGGEGPCLADPVRAVLTHVMGTHRLLREVIQQGIERFIFASTIAVYGTYRARPMPLSEEMEPRPDDFYAALKATAERELIDARCFQIFRLANVYGYGSGIFTLASGVVGKFVETVLAGKPLQIYGDGHQLIDYVHVEDVCDAFETALARPPENFIYNLGGGQPISIKTLAELVAQTSRATLKREVEIMHRPAPPNKIWPDRWLAIERAERELSWRPRVEMSAGVREMLENWATRPGIELEEQHA
jgi:nucleoside-diphosphate-sugar epimerase